jgi:hypothetical protein
MGTQPAPPPDNLKLKEEDSAPYVTEELAGMNRYIHSLLAVWFIAIVAFCLIVTIRIWPSVEGTSAFPADTTKATQNSAKPDRPTKDSLKAREVRMAKDSSKAVDSLKIGSGDKEEEEEGPLTRGQSLLLVSLLFGTLGGASHGLASLMDFRGQRRLFKSWTLWYFLLPFLGGCLAVVFYMVVRGGLLTTGNDAAGPSINPYGIAGLSAIVGLSTDRATNKLKEIFDSIFTTKSESRADTLSGDKKPKP